MLPKNPGSDDKQSNEQLNREDQYDTDTDDESSESSDELGSESEVEAANKQNTLQIPQKPIKEKADAEVAENKEAPEKKQSVDDLAKEKKAQEQVAAEKKLAEEKEATVRLQTQERLANANAYRYHFGIPTWYPTNEEGKQDEKPAGLETRSLLTEILADGLYRCDKFPKFAIELKQGMARPVPPPSKGDFEECYRAVIDFLAVSKGVRTIEIDWKKSNQFSEERLAIILKLAEERGLAVRFGSNINSFLQTQDKERSFIFNKDLKGEEKKLSPEDAKARRMKYAQILGDLQNKANARLNRNDVKAKQGDFARRLQEHPFQAERFELNRKVSAMKSAKKELDSLLKIDREEQTKQYLARVYKDTETIEDKVKVAKTEIDSLIERSKEINRTKGILESRLKNPKQLLSDPTFEQTQENRKALLKQLKVEGREVLILSKVWQAERKAFEKEGHFVESPNNGMLKSLLKENHHEMKQWQDHKEEGEDKSDSTNLTLTQIGEKLEKLDKLKPEPELAQEEKPSHRPS